MTGARVGRVGAVGKTPWRAEYLPVPTHAPSFAAFDAWLTLATEWAAQAAGPSWSVAFERGAMHGFVFHSPDERAEQVLCGALAPSRDSAGRQFPLAIGVPLDVAPRLLQRPELSPFVLEGLWAEATSALAESLTRPDASATVTAGASDVAEAAELYDGWAGSLPLGELWALLGPALVEPEASLRLVFETLAPFRGIEPVSTSLGLRLPLGQGGGATLCFWLDLARRYLGWRSTLPSFLWSHDGTNGVALLALGRLSKASLAELWLPTGTRDDIADLTTAVRPPQVEGFSPLSAAVSAALATPAAPLAQLLAAVGA
jgi:type VI secretion system ImpM family protein